MMTYEPDKYDFPVKPGDKVWWVDTGMDYSICEVPGIDGIAFLEDQLCVIIDGDLHEIGTDVFLTYEDAASWARENRKPSVWDLLETSPWHKKFPAVSGTYYVRFNNGDIQKLYYQDGTEEEYPEGFYSRRESCFRLSGQVEGWTNIPEGF